MAYNQPVRTTKKSSWLLIISGVLTSMIFTVWGGCLLLGCLLYVAYSDLGHKRAADRSGKLLSFVVFKKRSLR